MNNKNFLFLSCLFILLSQKTSRTSSYPFLINRPKLDSAKLFIARIHSGYFEAYVSGRDEFSDILVFEKIDNGTFQVIRNLSEFMDRKIEFNGRGRDSKILAIVENPDRFEELDDCPRFYS